MNLYTKTQLALLQSNHDTNEEARDFDGNTVDFQPVVKWFDAFGSATWLISEIDPDEVMAFGLCDLGMGFPEMGSVSIEEIRSVNTLGVPNIVRDIHWQATQSLFKYATEARRAGFIAEPWGEYTQGMTPREALQCVRVDLDMLQSGEWVPDNDSIERTRDMLLVVESGLIPEGVKEPGPDMERVMEAIEESWRGTYNPGFCTKCGYEQNGCEPDAEGYECENCGEHAVEGAENCLLSL